MRRKQQKEDDDKRQEVENGTKAARLAGIKYLPLHKRFHPAVITRHDKNCTSKAGACPFLEIRPAHPPSSSFGCCRAVATGWATSDIPHPFHTSPPGRFAALLAPIGPLPADRDSEPGPHLDGSHTPHDRVPGFGQIGSSSVGQICGSIRDSWM